MSKSFTSVDESRLGPGGWLFASLHTLYSISTAVSLMPAFEDPLPHGWSPEFARTAPAILLLLAILTLSSWLACTGSRLGRYAMLAAITAEVARQIPENKFAVFFMLSEMPGASIDDYLDIATAAAAGPLWVVCVFWYVLSSKKHAADPQVE